MEEFDTEVTLNNVLLRNVIVLLISITLAYGFWSETYFKDLDVMYLGIITAVILIVVIKLTIWVSAKDFFEKVQDGAIRFWKDDVDPIKYEEMTATIRPWKTRKIRIGKIYLAKLNPKSKKFFAKLSIKDNYRKTLGEINEEEAKYTGVKGLEEFKEKWVAKHRNWDPEQIVRVLVFHVKAVKE